MSRLHRWFLFGSLPAILLFGGCGHERAPSPAPSASTSAQTANPDALAKAARDGAAAARLLARQMGAIKAEDASSSATSAPSTPATDAQGYVELDWLRMIPPSELDALKNGSEVVHSGNRRMRQVGSYTIMPAVLGHKIKLPGYVVPMETDDRGRMTEFFFVPFFGACIHVPAPPPNQIIYARLAKAVKTPEIWEPYWLKGELTDEKVNSSVAGSAYTMNTAVLEPYDG
jgi:hypothetical protein